MSYMIRPTSPSARRKRFSIATALLLGTAALPAGCSREDTASQESARATTPPALNVKPGSARGRNVLLVTLDTTRADRLGCYGYAEAQTPNLDRLAAEGVRFADAVTCVPITLPSHAAILTGKYPPNIDVRDNGLFRLADEHQTLAELLRDHGYATAAFIAAFVLDRRYGVDQGFAVYNDDITLRFRRPGVRQASPQRPADVVIDDALAWLEQRQRQQPGEPFFAWVHLFDPHTPYTPPEPFRRRFSDRLYDGEIAFADHELGRLLGYLRERELGKRTITVIVGDHGEGLGDHHEATHSLLIYDSTMRVPLIFHGPGVIPASVVVDDRVAATVDLLPTILDLLGESAPSCDGISLLRPTARADRAVYLETLAPRLNHGWSELFGLRTHGAKYIRAPTPEYYDLQADPDESHNLLPANASQGETLRRQLDERLAEMNATTGTPTLAPDEETRRQLQALGYVGGAEDYAEDAGPRPDPKEMIPAWQAEIATVVTDVDQGRFAQAIPHLEKLLQKTPHDARLWNLLTLARAGLRRFEEALESCRKSVEFQPANADYWIQMARLHRVLGDRDAAQAALARAAELESDHGEVPLLRAEMAMEAADYRAALALCEEARRRDPTRHTATSWSLQGDILERLGQPAEARACFERAYAADPRDAGALVGLARIAQRENQPQRVIELASEVLRGTGGWTESRNLLARAYLKLGRGPDAIATMKALAEAVPQRASDYSNLGNVYYQLDRYSEAAEAYHQALEIDPRYATGHYNLGNTLKELGRYEDAARHFTRAAELNPDLYQAKLALARVEALRGRLEQSAALLEELLSSGKLSLEEINAEPDFRPVLSDPRFRRLRQERGAPGP
jgi:arylsulfatase A-like enzyme/Flp pilus assembly protein TadD